MTQTTITIRLTRRQARSLLAMAGNADPAMWEDVIEDRSVTPEAGECACEKLRAKLQEKTP